jgi:RNA polymerase primary sigma factor
MLTSDGTELLEAVYTREKNEAIRKTLNTLTPREAEVLRLRNGVDRRDELTLSDTAKTLGITQSRVRQIESQALRKMRGPDRSQRIKQFVEEA